MVPVVRLSRAATGEEAAALHDHFDVVPFPRRGRITGYYLKGSPGVVPISADDILSHGTPIIDLAALFLRRPFGFVIQANTIVGYAHYSDLNKPMAKVPFFAAFQLAESAVLERIRNDLTEPTLRALLDRGEFDRLARTRARVARRNVDVGWQGILSLRDVLVIAGRNHKTRLTDHDRRLVVEFRNRSAHATSTLIQREGDLRDLAKAASMARRLARSA